MTCDPINRSSQSQTATLEALADSTRSAQIPSGPLVFATLVRAMTVPMLLQTLGYARPSETVIAPAMPHRASNSYLDSTALFVVKPLCDVALVALTALVWAPLCLVIAVAIWLEDGAWPLFFQKRVGRDGRLFTMWKFRTMHPNAGELLRKQLLNDGAVKHAWDDAYKLKNDPRITRVGRVLRRYSLDELPQVVNVLLGHMSLVGPRPLPEYHHCRLSPSTQEIRQQVRPGLTGLWQVSGRSDIGNRGMELWDPFYVRNWSLWLDFSIITRTARAVVRGTGAY